MFSKRSPVTKFPNVTETSRKAEARVETVLPDVEQTPKPTPWYTRFFRMHRFRTFLGHLPLRALFMGVLGIAVGAALLGGLFLWQTYSRVSVQAPVISPSPGSVEPTPDPYAPTNILLLGYGGGTHEGGKLTDTIMVAHIDPREEKITLISLPRDLWVSFPVDGEQESYWKLNAAYQIGSSDANYPHKLPQYSGEAGGGELAKYAVGKVLGQPIQYFAALSFSGFTKSIDTLNGVDVQVDRTFDDYWYPIEGEENNSCGRSEEDIAALTATLSGTLLEESFPCRYEHLHFDAGRQHMDGATALKFVRSRHSAQDGNDFSRTARQRNLLVAVKQKVIDVRFLPRLIPFITSLTTDMQTDISLRQVQEWVGQQDELSRYEIQTVALTDQNILKNARSGNGQYILIPKDGEDNWASVQSWLNEQLIPPTATDSAQTTQSATASGSATVR